MMQPSLTPAYTTPARTNLPEGLTEFQKSDSYHSMNEESTVSIRGLGGSVEEAGSIGLFQGAVRTVGLLYGSTLRMVLAHGRPPPPGWTQPPTEPIGRFIKDGNFELLGQWNTVEVMWQGDKASPIVNGRTVNVASKLQQPDPQNAGKYIPLTRGKIAIEIEFAEIWFRRIEVKSLV